MRHIINISGKDSLWTADVQRRRRPDLLYEYLYNPTGLDLPEIDEWLGKVEGYLGQPIERVGDDLEAIKYEEGILPAHKRRYCTRRSKIFPMEDYIGTDEATVYYGLRADEPARVGYQGLSGRAITAVYPLREEGITLPMVWEGVSELGLMPPAFFWPSMYEMVVARLGSYATGILDTLKPWERTVLFAWRSRPNCYDCFYMRLYEFVGLLEFHPDLFWHADEVEREIGTAAARKKPFTIKQNWPLQRIAAEAERIKRARCAAICKILWQRNLRSAQLALPFDTETELDEEPDLLSLVPCGLFCGK